VKTAISLPDDTFRRATHAAAELGVSRSELFARAMEQYLDRLSAESLTAELDAAIERDAGRDDSGAEAARQGARTVLALTADDEW
jgi:antitoxin MazE6